VESAATHYSLSIKIRCSRSSGCSVGKFARMFKCPSIAGQAVFCVRLALRRPKLLPDGQITSPNQKSRQAEPAKIFPFPFSEINDYPLPIPPPLEGRIAIVTDVGSGMRWTRGGSARICAPTKAFSRTAKACRPGALVAGAKLAEDDPQATVTQKPVSPGRARHSPLKPLRRECRIVRRTCGD
jgi:hypothetical protein